MTAGVRRPSAVGTRPGTRPDVDAPQPGRHHRSRRIARLGSVTGVAEVLDIPYTVRRSTRARRVRVNVHAHTGVEVVLPTRASERAAAAAVSELRPWIERRLGDAPEVLARSGGRA